MFRKNIKNDLGFSLRPLRLCGEDSSAGFSLIEVLVAMAVMVVIILMVTNMFRDASEAWDMGTQRAEMNTAARAAIEYIARELSCAVAGSIPDATGGVAILKPFKLANGTNLYFSALSSDEETLRGVMFRLDEGNHCIEYSRETTAFKPYETTVWSVYPGRLLITNVWRFAITVCSNEGDMHNGSVGYAYDSSEQANSNLLPACVDISIEMLGERDMARAVSLVAGADGYVMTNSRVYTTRVCFPNRGSR